MPDFGLAGFLLRHCQGGAKIKPQRRMDNFEEITRRFPAGEAQKASGVLARMNDVVLFVDQDAGRRVFLDDFVMNRPEGNPTLITAEFFIRNADLPFAMR